ncbi:hypothetical protein KEM48_012660 [Puccinia striiformis f. sp. tritici PST-130]|nr:hypothetical protein KEM48_012660 [Puccinia striiformis f. sp. tritici PST-130]
MNGRIMVGESGKPGKGNKCGVMVLKLTWIKAILVDGRFVQFNPLSPPSLGLSASQTLPSNTLTHLQDPGLVTSSSSRRWSSLPSKLTSNLEPSIKPVTVDHPISQPFGILQAAPCAITQPSPALLNA